MFCFRIKGKCNILNIQRKCWSIRQPEASANIILLWKTELTAQDHVEQYKPAPTWDAYLLCKDTGPTGTKSLKIWLLWQMYKGIGASWDEVWQFIHMSNKLELTQIPAKIKLIACSEQDCFKSERIFPTKSGISIAWCRNHNTPTIQMVPNKTFSHKWLVLKGKNVVLKLNRPKMGECWVKINTSRCIRCIP